MSALIRIADFDDQPAWEAVRREVFIIGQGVPEDLELDGHDIIAIHFLAEVAGEPVGTARLRMVDGHAKAERVSVLEAHRGRGIGQSLMHALEAQAELQGASEIHLHAQLQVVPFYEALGYAVHGERFVEADIEHLAMTKALRPH